jgi:cardiolipin synthase
VTITSPYFVPDESLLTAISGAAYRGVEVELFVGESADQFLVGHAQRSYYRALLEAGVRIHLFPAPKILHSKYVTVDDRIAVIGSSNMDPRSFALDYEIMLLTFGGSLVADLVANDAEYRAISHELTPEEWESQGFLSRYVDNVCRLTSALM